jgi:hypothetical protein
MRGFLRIKPVKGDFAAVFDVVAHGVREFDRIRAGCVRQA